MDNKRLGKALDIMRLAEEAAARPGGISLVQIVDTFGVTLRTAQRMSRALEEAFPMVQTRTDKERRKWWQLSDSRLLHMQGIRDSELSALEMGIRRAERDGAATEVAALTTTMPATGCLPQITEAMLVTNVKWSVAAHPARSAAAQPQRADVSFKE